MKVEACKFPSRVRLGLTLSIILMVISSPVMLLVNPPQVAAAATNTTTNNNMNKVDSTNYHSTPRIPVTPLTSTPTDATAPSTLSQDGSEGGFTTQAALSLTRASQTNNFVASKAYYDISFRTATAGVIKHIFMDFPTGTSVGSALVVEVTGIGPGTLNADPGVPGRLIYTVTNAVNVPANTNIRMQISNINNPPNPSGSLIVIITTATAAFGLIDTGATSPYNMVQVGNSQIAPGAVTTTKIATGAVGPTDIAQSFMKRVTVLDNAAGDDVGWNPDGVKPIFLIEDPNVLSDSGTFVSAIVDVQGGEISCSVTDIEIAFGTFTVLCASPPPEDTILQYLISNLPANVIT